MTRLAVLESTVRSGTGSEESERSGGYQDMKTLLADE